MLNFNLSSVITPVSDSNCRNPAAIKGRSAESQIAYKLTGEKVRVSLNDGLQCNNTDQSDDGKCEDYEIKLCCQSN